MAMASVDDEVESLRRQLNEKEKLLEVETLRRQLAEKQALLDQLAADPGWNPAAAPPGLGGMGMSSRPSDMGLGMPTGGEIGAAPPLAPAESEEQLVLAELISYMRSPVPEELQDALFTISDMVSYAYDQDGARIGEVMRTQGGLTQLTWILADREQPLEVHQQVLLLIGNLCSDSVDPNSMLSKRYLLDTGVEQVLFNFLDPIANDDVATLIFACGAVQNLCHDTEWSARALQHGVREQLSELLNHADDQVIKYAAGALKNISTTTQADLDTSATEAIAKRSKQAAVANFTERRALRVITKHIQAIPPDVRLRRVLQARGILERPTRPASRDTAGAAAKPLTPAAPPPPTPPPPRGVGARGGRGGEGVGARGGGARAAPGTQEEAEGRRARAAAAAEKEAAARRAEEEAGGSVPERRRADAEDRARAEAAAAAAAAAEAAAASARRRNGAAEERRLPRRRRGARRRLAARPPRRRRGSSGRGGGAEEGRLRSRAAADASSPQELPYTMHTSLEVEAHWKRASRPSMRRTFLRRRAVPRRVAAVAARPPPLRRRGRRGRARRPPRPAAYGSS